MLKLSLFSIDYQDDAASKPDASRRQFGHSKEGTWTTRVVVASAVTHEGIPVRSWVLPGSRADVSMFEKVRAEFFKLKPIGDNY